MVAQKVGKSKEKFIDKYCLFCLVFSVYFINFQEDFFFFLVHGQISLFLTSFLKEIKEMAAGHLLQEISA